jgi:phosphoglucosamine mutase
MEQLKRCDGILGGEPSGHIICRDRTSTGDGIVAALQVLAGLERLDVPLDQIGAEVETYPQILINVRLDEPAALVGRTAVSHAVASAERALGERGRILLRPSGTEPLIRVMVEGVDETEVRQLAERLAEVVRTQAAIRTAPNL